MSNVIDLVSFKLKEGVSEEEFLLASEELNVSFLSLQKGYIFRKLLKKEDTWTDLVLWETIDDANAMRASEEIHHNTLSYFDYIEENSCEFIQDLAVVKSY